jgi:hypothetical protein
MMGELATTELLDEVLHVVLHPAKDTVEVPVDVASAASGEGRLEVREDETTVDVDELCTGFSA